MEEFNEKERWQKLAGISEEEEEESGELAGAGLQKLKTLLGDIAPDVDRSKGSMALNNLFSGKKTSPIQNVILVDILKGMLKSDNINAIKAVLVAVKEK